MRGYEAGERAEVRGVHGMSKFTLTIEIDKSYDVGPVAAAIDLYLHGADDEYLMSRDDIDYFLSQFIDYLRHNISDYVDFDDEIDNHEWLVNSLRDTADLID